MGHENTPIRDDGRPQAYLGTACNGHQEELCDQIRLVKTIYNRGQKSLGHLCNVTDYVCFRTEL